IAQRKKWDQIQKDCCERALGVITVSQEMKEILQSQGIPDHKITVLPNTVDIEKFQAYAIDQTVLSQHADKFVLTYIGFINGIHRGIHTLLEAMALLKDKIPTLHFVGAGGTREPYLSELKAIIAKHQLEPFVSFTGWLDESAFGSYIQASNVCLTPHIANDQTNTGIPNKVYLYHLWKKPIIASDFIPMKRYLDITQGGLSFASGDAQGLADQILTLYENPAISETLAQNGYEAVIHTYNWRKTSEALKALYAKALPIHTRQSTKS
ncbi:MAG: glycosyltransferase, partial [Cyanobacteria bacterium]|nr:glycosyltransferase [Cyanobacteriota bacterium]